MPPSINEFEDLTQFADESFDTEEVDLFEFAEDDDSPLLRLKSIVLSLDWDITEDILTELSEELANLKALWKEDKVAQIYLQGMDNVGQYLRAEGAYAHPNAIKLLLTLYYNYEKIISSPNISGESITTMLKADIRKFKVLQYQISALRKANAEEHAPEAPAKEEEKTAPAPEKAAPAPARPDEKSNIPEPLRSMEATILGLEWEVTDEGLEKFHQEALELRQHLSGNTEAQVLVQGLQALGAYIREQTSNAHPDSFTILHSFYDALKMLLDSPNLAAEQRRQILVEQISSLNSLKDIIAKSAAVGRGGSVAPAEEETARPASEKKQAAGKKQQAAPQEEETDIAAEDGMDIEALFDDEEDDSSADELFADAAPEGKQAPPAEKAAPAKAVAHPPRPAPAAAGDDDDEWPDDALFSSGGGVMPALVDEDEEGGFTAKLENDITEERAAEFDEKLDSFFDFGDEDKGGAKKQEQASAADENLEMLFNEEEAQPVSTSETAKLSSSGTLDDELDSFFAFADEDESVSKNKEADISFADEPKQPEAAAGEDEDNLELDSFFNFDDDEPAEKIVPKIEKADRLIGSAGKVETARKATPAALADDEEDEESDEEGELDSFFNFEDEPAAKINEPDSHAALEPEQPEAAALDADEDDGLDAFFNLDEDIAAPDAEETGSLRLNLDDAEELELASEKVGGEVPEQPEATALDADEDDDLDAFFNLDEDIAAPDAEEETGSLRLDLDDAEELDADSFFEVEEEAAETEHAETADVLSDAADDEFDSFFNMEDASAPDAKKAAALGLNDAEKLAADSLFGEVEVAALSDAAEDDSGFSSMDDHASKPDDKEMARLSLDDAEKLAVDSLMGGKETSLADEEEDDDLDSFFNFDEDAPALEPEAREADSLTLDEAEEFASDSLFGEEETPETEPESAAQPELESADEDLDSFFSMGEDAPALEEPDDSLSVDEAADALASDSLFGEEETPETEPESSAAMPEFESADEDLDSFFSMDEDAPTLEPDDSLSVDEAADALASDSLFGEEETPETEPKSAAAQPELESADEDLDSFFSMDEDAPALEPDDSLSVDEAADALASDNLFGEEETPETEPESAAAQPELESADEDLDSFFSMDEDAPALEEPDDSLSVDEAADALASDSLFGEEETPETEPESAAQPELESADEDLDSFFSMDEDIPTLEPEAGEADSLTLDEAEELSADSFFGDTPAETEEDRVPSELESADEDSDDFFGMEDVQSAASEETAQKGIDQEQATEIKEKLDSLFSFDDDALTDEGIPQTDETENGFMMPFADGEHGDEAPSAEEDIFSESDKAAVFEFDDDAEDNVFAIAQGGDEVPSVFTEESEFDSLFEEQADETAIDDAFADVQDEPQAEDIDIFSLAQQDAADGDFLTALKERENAVEEEEATALLQAKAEEELILGKEYEDTEGVFSQLAQDAVPDAFEESAQAAGTEHSAGAASASVFSSLALAASALTTAPSAHNLQQISELAAAARQEEAVPPNKIILLHLLDSSSAMLAKASGSKAMDSGTALVQELAAGLDAADEPGKLPEIISRYTAWQQNFFEQLMMDIPRPVSRPAAGLEQLQDEVTQLKQYLINEIRLFRQELGKR